MRYIIYILCFTLGLISQISFAQTQSLSLYEQPNAKAKVIATVAGGQAIIPIFTQGDWIKVADPSNGNVGWIEKKILNTQGYPSFLIKTHGERGKDKSSSSYQIIEINLPNKEQMQNLMQNFQNQQKQFQQLFNRMMDENITDFNQLFKIKPEVGSVIQPIILQPENKTDQSESEKTKSKTN